MILNYKQGKGDKIHILIDGEYRFTVDKAYFELLRLCQNTELTQNELDELEVQIYDRRAYNQAVSYLSRRDHSKKELITKLKMKGFSDNADEVVELLCEKGYVDDERFAQMYAKEMINIKKFGIKRIEQELYKKGISRDIISSVTENLDSDSEALELLIRRKYMRYLSDERGIRRTVNSLIRLGYTYSDIKNALEIINDESFSEVNDE